MNKYLRLLQIFFKLSLSRAVMYKADFITWSLVSIGWTILMVIFFEIVFLNTTEIGGWTKSQIILMQGFYFVIEFVMWGILWENMREIPEKINKGTMDLELVKPINQQFMLSFKNISFDNINNLVLGIITILYAVKIGNMHPSLGDVALSCLALIFSSIFIYAGWFMTMCVAFWFDRFENLHFLFPSLRQFWKMPQSFYGGALKIIVTFFVPIALVTTIPAEFIIGRQNWQFFAVLVIVSLGMLYMSHKFFKIAVRHYASASS